MDSITVNILRRMNIYFLQLTPYTRLSFFYVILIRFLSFRFVAFKYRINITSLAIAERTGHRKESVLVRIKTGDINFSTSEVVHSSNPMTTAAHEEGEIEKHPPMVEEKVEES